MADNAKITIVDGATVLATRKYTAADGSLKIDYEGDGRFDRLVKFAAHCPGSIRQQHPDASASEIKKLVIEACWQQQLKENGPYDEQIRHIVLTDPTHYAERMRQLGDPAVKNGVIHVAEIGKGSHHPERGLVCAHRAPEMAAMLAAAGYESKVFSCKWKGMPHLTVATGDEIVETTAPHLRYLHKKIVFGNLTDLAQNRNVLICVDANKHATILTNPAHHENAADLSAESKFAKTKNSVLPPPHIPRKTPIKSPEL